jgi:hypothetical protein
MTRSHNIFLAALAKDLLAESWPKEDGLSHCHLITFYCDSVLAGVQALSKG